MNRLTATLSAAAIVATGLLTIGCDEKPAATPTPAASSDATPATPAMPGALEKARDQAQSTVDAAQAKMAATGDDASKAAADAGAKASDAGNAIVGQAQTLFDNAKAAIQKANLNDAQKYVDQLNALKAKLPADWQAKVDEVTKMLSDAKSKLGNMSLPSMPK